MSILFMLLVAGPALAGPADCQAVPVGPPMDLQVWTGAPSRNGGAGTSGQATVTMRMRDVPSLGTRCIAPPPTGDALHGPPAPHGLLRDIPARDVLRGAPVRSAPPPRQAEPVEPED